MRSLDKNSSIYNQIYDQTTIESTADSSLSNVVDILKGSLVTKCHNPSLVAFEKYAFNDNLTTLSQLEIFGHFNYAK